VQAFGGKQAADASAISRICQYVGNLPLALRLVGRYLAEQEEEAGAYLAWLEQTPLAALDQGTSRQESVPVLLERTTLQLSATAQQVLRLVGLLALAAFDRELVAQTLELSEEDARRALAELVNYGLLVRQQNHYEVSHPLIHTYARERLVAQDDAAAQRALLERLVCVLEEQFPQVEYANWRRCEALLPHVQACATLISQQQVCFPEASYLLMRAGWYVREQGQFTQAAQLLQQALTLAERALGSDDVYLGAILTNLAILYRAQGRYAEAEPLYMRTLATCEQTLGLDHPETATTLQNLAILYRAQGRYAEAEPLFQRSLVISEQALPPDHPETAATLQNLAILYREQGRYAEAEPLYQRSLAIKERVLPPDHPDIAITLNNLAFLYRGQGRYAEAEPLFQRSLVISEQALGLDHPSTAITLDNLAQLYGAQRRYEKAEPLFQRALAIYEQALGPDHPDTADVQENYAYLLREMNRPTEAQRLERRTGAMRDRLSSKKNI
jgi:tetratricopeptide (TPR) repeat protein